MATLITDDFNRANASTLGANWTEVTGDHSIVSNRARLDWAGGVGLGSLATARHVTPLDDADQYAELLFIGDASGTSGTVGGTCVRFSSTAATFYYAWVRAAFSVTIGKEVAGSRTTLASMSPPVTTFPIHTRLEVEGSALRHYIEGVLQLEATDTQITGNTQVGIHGHPDKRIAVVDDFEAGVLAADPPPPSAGALLGPNGRPLRGPNGGLLRLAP